MRYRVSALTVRALLEPVSMLMWGEHKAISFMLPHRTHHILGKTREIAISVSIERVGISERIFTPSSCIFS